MIAIWLGGFIFVALNLLLGTWFQDRIYPGVKVSSIELGGFTRIQAQTVLQAQIKAYHLVLSVDGSRYNVRPQDIGADYDTGLTSNQAFSAGRSAFLPLIGLFQAANQSPINYSYSVNRAALTDFVSHFTSLQQSAPVDATVVVANGVPVVSPDKSGLGINKIALASVLADSIVNQTEHVSIQRGPVPAETTTAKAEPAAAEARNLVATPLTLTYNDKQFVPTPSQIGSWLTFAAQADGTLASHVDQDKVRAYLASIAGGINITPVTQVINVVNGEVKSQDGGANGLAVDTNSLSNQVVAAIMAAKPASLAIPTVIVPFKTSYNKTISLDAAQYIEINLTTQHLWAYQDHLAIYDSPVTSGASRYGFGTVTGLFSIYGKETNRYLNGHNLGYNYDVFVQYWMPFYADYGLHDASWRNGSFGGQDYLYNGSHGCVNLPLATAAWLYGWASIGTPVWVHT